MYVMLAVRLDKLLKYCLVKKAETNTQSHTKSHTNKQTNKPTSQQTQTNFVRLMQLAAAKAIKVKSIEDKKM